MIDYQALTEFLTGHPRLHRWCEQLEDDIHQGLSPQRFGDLPAWLEALQRLPHIEPQTLQLADEVSVSGICDEQTREQARAALQALIPWRKGPYTLHDIHIDTEWRSDWKWERIRHKIAPLHNRLVLDVGCGNGYHGWRMLGDGAARVIGIDPSPRFVVQFAAIKHFLGRSQPIDVLPIGIEKLPSELRAFDTTFSMGVFYHRRSPMDHLRELKDTLRAGGQLVLETLVIEGGEGEVLVPKGRYAMMNNVWFIPTPDTLISWMRKCGFNNARLVDLCPTTVEEQRATEWMKFHSLENFLDPQDPGKTIEGYPGPIRATLVAEA
ncbi:tRNA 5-methoxyuridine(34)/uridine 5-oxyacetic acid(34) synthase CmoB [Gilvimarinus sp. DA14]|uniref:tRNA 5-methoxyuridine(34)/uridine 5-oxyacetic acid(34) synthase CmoB n=1 Tax=Gilvimarinus sp. DA14 TaxID=2956798 RepID=UPI0020B7F2B6|nr:tRNA 5-methoxyuridine(34)/uridine 5-oxyacetic acid(34) synthase CmoB [Gilvimarinus sp. DA14]UTF60958.1 tRNA 5-methoxyuridine(34)/uridine 5-oxyacetic acid(34) synthase CmoB [Gilvimarinus sp. DA14]